MGQAFVQAPEHRPKPTVTEATVIPLIDLSPLTAGEAAAVDALAAEVGAASREWGFFVVVGHGVPAEAVARATAAQRAFFALPAERKAAVRRSEAEPLGYYESEHTKNVRDWKEVFDLVAREPPPPAARSCSRTSGPRTCQASGDRTRSNDPPAGWFLNLC